MVGKFNNILFINIAVGFVPNERAMYILHQTTGEVRTLQLLMEETLKAKQARIEISQFERKEERVGKKLTRQNATDMDDVKQGCKSVFKRQYYSAECEKQSVKTHFFSRSLQECPEITCSQQGNDKLQLETNPGSNICLSWLLNVWRCEAQLF